MSSKSRIKNILSFENQVALVTGAASGMGLAAVKNFAESGAAVALLDINKAAVDAIEQEMTLSGYTVLAIQCDVTDEEQVKSAIETIVLTFGRLDVAFNNAGVQSPAIEIADCSNEEYDRILSINLRGVWNCMKYELQHMREQGGGAIVNNSSLGGLVGVAGRAAYHAAKHGILGLTKSSALEYATKGIRINAVCPGIIDTPMVAEMLKGETEVMNEMMRDVPMQRLGKAEEIADVVLWLCSSGASFVIGQAIAVDGGYTVR